MPGEGVGGPTNKAAVKVVALISALPDISRDDFIAYYEANHVPLVRRLLPTIGDYRRNYVEPQPINRPGEPSPGFDVITELWFETEDDYQAFRRTVSDPEVVAQIRADEANFLVSARTRMHVVREHIAPPRQG